MLGELLSIAWEYERVDYKREYNVKSHKSPWVYTPNEREGV